MKLALLIFTMGFLTSCGDMLKMPKEVNSASSPLISNLTGRINTATSRSLTQTETTLVTQFCAYLTSKRTSGYNQLSTLKHEWQIDVTEKDCSSRVTSGFSLRSMQKLSNLFSYIISPNSTLNGKTELLDDVSGITQVICSSIPSQTVFNRSSSVYEIMFRDNCAASEICLSLIKGGTQVTSSQYEVYARYDFDQYTTPALRIGHFSSIRFETKCSGSSRTEIQTETFNSANPF